MINLALYRQIFIEFWRDPKVTEEMSAEDRYALLYLLTNPHTTQIGIYQITKRQMAFDLGYSTESVGAILERFEKLLGKIRYNPETREIAKTAEWLKILKEQLFVMIMPGITS